MRIRRLIPLGLLTLALQPQLLPAQDEAGRPPRQDGGQQGGPGQQGPGQQGPGGFGFGPGGGFPGMGMGGPNRQSMKVLEKFDANKDGWLNTEERTLARKYVLEQKAQNPGRGGFGPPMGFGPPGNQGGQPGAQPGPEGRPNDNTQPQQPRRPDEGGRGPEGRGQGGPGQFGGRGGRGPGGPGMRNMPPAQTGKHVAKSDVAPVTGSLYDPSVLRTIFLDFENKEWEAELSDFRDTDVDVAATMTVDGKEYPLVGVRFRGNTSLAMVPNGYKKPLNLSVDMANEDQRLYGYKTLNLLNGVNDPTLMSAALYSHLATTHFPAPKANLVRLVVNGENWGIYSNVQQINKEFLKEHYETTKGARWKVPGSPQSRGGLQYFGDDLAAYERVFEAKDASEKDWKKLIDLCKTLNETPKEQLAAAIKPLLDIDELMWFLAIDIASVNSDGYWTRGSDYYIWLDPKGKFHIYPYDMNEAFLAGHGPGGGPGGPGGRGGMGPGGPGGGPGGGLGGPGAGGRPGEQDARPPREGQAGDRPREGRPEGRPEGGQGQDGRGPEGRRGGGMGMGFGGPGGGPGGGGGPELDPLAGLNNERFPLRSKLLEIQNSVLSIWKTFELLATKCPGPKWNQ